MSKIQDHNPITDLSGTSNTTFSNPYDGLLNVCHNSPVFDKYQQEIQLRYQTHRDIRNQQQKAKLLSPDFGGFAIDPVLEKLLNSEKNPGYVDPRNCLVFWGRPPSHIRTLVGELQNRLRGIAPSLWFMPLENLHMTVLEVTHSKTAPEIESLVQRMGEKAIATLTDYTCAHRARLVKPLLSYDAAAIALSFVPAAGEDSAHGAGPGANDEYTYHHLRRDAYAFCLDSGVEVASRYVVPSAHLTIARFVDQSLFEEEKVEGFVERLEGMNRELRDGSREEERMGEGDGRDGVQWVVGEEKGLECRTGKLWYGGGERVRLGKGF